MAYTNMERNRTGTLVAVGALHLGVIYALVVGLAGPVWKVIEDQPLVGEQIPLPTPPRATERPAVDPVTQPKTAERDQGRSEVFVMNTGNSPADGREIVLPPFEGGTVIGDPPPPPQPPVVSLTPKRARPVGQPGLWVTPNDYPAADLRAEHEGTTRFELSIGADGRVQSCRIVASSGWASLDSAACAKLTRRGKFAAATDASGAAVASTYSSAVQWIIPKN